MPWTLSSLLGLGLLRWRPASLHLCQLAVPQAPGPALLCRGGSCLFVHWRGRVLPVVCCVTSVTSELFFAS